MLQSSILLLHSVTGSLLLKIIANYFSILYYKVVLLLFIVNFTTLKMALREEVILFLQNMKSKMEVFDIVFRDDRTKNTQALLAFELHWNDRKTIIKDLDWRDYSEGPKEENIYGLSEMWVFGKEIKRNEFYIKISMGRPNSSVICISFHPSAFPLKYPFK